MDADAEMKLKGGPKAAWAQLLRRFTQRERTIGAARLLTSAAGRGKKVPVTGLTSRIQLCGVCILILGPQVKEFERSHTYFTAGAKSDAGSRTGHTRQAQGAAGPIGSGSRRKKALEAEAHLRRAMAAALALHCRGRRRLGLSSRARPPRQSAGGAHQATRPAQKAHVAAAIRHQREAASAPQAPKAAHLHLAGWPARSPPALPRRSQRKFELSSMAHPPRQNACGAHQAPPLAQKAHLVAAHRHQREAASALQAQETQLQAG